MKDTLSGAVHAENRRLAAIMFTDIVGFSRQMGADEARTLRILAIHNQVIELSLEVHKERVPIKDPAVLERHLAALRKTGLK
jgi:class 3 adenylate cyclase